MSTDIGTQPILWMCPVVISRHSQYMEDKITILTVSQLRGESFHSVIGLVCIVSEFTVHEDVEMQLLQSGYSREVSLRGAHFCPTVEEAMDFLQQLQCMFTSTPIRKLVVYFRN